MLRTGACNGRGSHAMIPTPLIGVQRRHPALCRPPRRALRRTDRLCRVRAFPTRHGRSPSQSGRSSTSANRARSTTMASCRLRRRGRGGCGSIIRASSSRQKFPTRSFPSWRLSEDGGRLCPHSATSPSSIASRVKCSSAPRPSCFTRMGRWRMWYIGGEGGPRTKQARSCPATVCAYQVGRWDRVEQSERRMFGAARA